MIGRRRHTAPSTMPPRHIWMLLCGDVVCAHITKLPPPVATTRVRRHMACAARAPDVAGQHTRGRGIGWPPPL